MKVKQLELELLVTADTPDTVADTVKHAGGFSTITIRWKKGSKFPTIRGQWKRLPDGRIEARYTRDELAICQEKFEAIYGADLK